MTALTRFMLLCDISTVVTHDYCSTFVRNGVDRDRGEPFGSAPLTPPGIRVTYHGGSIGLSVGRTGESGETD